MILQESAIRLFKVSSRQQEGRHIQKRPLPCANQRRAWGKAACFPFRLSSSIAIIIPIIIIAMGLMALFPIAFAVAQTGSFQTLSVTSPYFVDADTLRLNKKDFSLTHLDGLERKQKCFDKKGKRYKCGEEARLFMMEKTKNKQVSCVQEAQDRFLGLFGRCTVNGQDLGELLIDEGWAVARGKRYVARQNKARLQRKGMWQGQFVLPAAWRRGLTLQGNTKAGAGPCMVKANIESNGNRRYYTTNDPDYHRVAITPSKGESFYCSVEEAYDNGFTRPGPKCQIKGIVEPSGRRVYYLPEDEPYRNAKINFANGDRWLCTAGHAYFEKFRRCLIKGKIVPDGPNAYYTPKSKNYKTIKVIRDQGDKWICTPQMAVRAGFIKRMP